jgi:hypothetical protein
MTYTNLWTAEVPVVDIQGEVSSYNPSSQPQAGAILSEHSHVTFTLSKWFKKHTELGLIFKGVSAAIPGGLPLGRIDTSDGRLVSPPVPPHHAVILYHETMYALSTGYYSNQAPGCNDKGLDKKAWVTSAFPLRTGGSSHHAFVSLNQTTSGLVPKGAISLASLISSVDITPAAEGPNTSPSIGPTWALALGNHNHKKALPKGLGLPTYTFSVVPNHKMVTYTNGKKGTVYGGWKKDILESSNRHEPEKIIAHQVTG